MTQPNHNQHSEPPATDSSPGLAAFSRGSLAAPLLTPAQAAAMLAAGRLEFRLMLEREKTEPVAQTV